MAVSYNGAGGAANNNATASITVSFQAQLAPSQGTSGSAVRGVDVAAPAVRHDPLLALDQTVQRLESLLFVPHGDDTGFDLHSLPMNEFLSGMAACGEPGSFLDLGCGIGTKLLVAHYLGWSVAGVERHPDYAAVAQQLVPEAEVTVGDAWTADLSGFDVVYSYRLMVDLDDQHQLNASIIARMRPGALYFCAGSDPVGLESVGAGVWRVT